ncbi:MAG: PQQ-binding-like beta-propeller repeat protein [Planctomycetaceae bacterium]
MPRSDDEYDEVDELEDVEDVEEVDELEDVVEDVDEVEDPTDKGRRQLQRGRLSKFSDSLTGGAARPGEEDVKRSPFIMFMAGAIILLAIVALVFGVMILSASEERAYTSAADKLKEESFVEAEKKFKAFLDNYSTGEYAERARIGLHTARVKQYYQAGQYTPDDVKNGVHELNEMIRVCRDLPLFAEERDNVRRYADRLARVGAIVAAEKRQNEPLEQSEVAFKLLGQYAGPDGLPASTEAEIRSLQRKAQAAILKQQVLSDALAEIKGHLDGGDTFAALESRQALLDRYDDVLLDDPEVGKILDDILASEKNRAVAADVGKEATTEDIPSAGEPSASLTLRTRTTVDQVSQGRAAFAMGLDSCYGLDSETGEPLWKRQVGANPPFAPIPVSSSQPGLLVFHTGLSELLMLAQEDGSLIWRQSIPGRPSGVPLVHEQQIYLTTTSGEIWRLSVDNGKAISKVTFNQPVIGPPAVTRDRKYMVVPGDQSVIYTLSINPLECVAVSYVEHRLGSVEAPIQTMGRILLLCDNDVAEEARLRVLDVDDAGAVTVRYTTKVDGQVRDACQLRGTELFVPSTPQRITAFSVNDSPEADPPIARIGSNQLEAASTAPVHLYAGSGGQLWMASQGLRKFRVRTNAVELESEATAPGLHLQPIQVLDQTRVFLTTNEPYSRSVFFTMADPGEMTGQWRTAVGTNVVAAGPSESGDQMLLVSDFGFLFRVAVANIRSGGFILDSLTPFQLPAKLEKQVGGLTLNDGRVAAWCGGDSPSMWTFNQAGQLEQRWGLPAEPQLPPVSLSNAAVFAMDGRLHCAGVKGARILDYRAAEGINENTTWKSLVALNDNQVLAINSKNEAVRVELRTSGQPSLIEVSRTTLPVPIELRPTSAGDLLVAVNAEGLLQVMSTTTLEILGQTPLGGLPSQPALVAGDRIFVDVARQELKVFERAGTLQQTGSVRLDGRFLVGPPVPVSSGGFVMCLSDGQVLVVDAAGNPTEKVMNLGQAALMGPLVIGEAMIVVSIDGSLYAVEDILN